MKHLILKNNIITEVTDETIRDVGTDIFACIRLLCPVGYDPNLFLHKVINYLEKGKKAFPVEKL